MSSASSQAISGDVSFSDSKSNTWIIAVVIGAVIVLGLWIVNRK